MVAEATALRWAEELKEQARFEAFRRERLAYEASKKVYMVDRQLEVWEQALPNMTKYILAVDPNKIEIRMNWQEDSSIYGGAFGGPEETTGE